MTTQKTLSSQNYVRFKQYRCRRSAQMFRKINNVLASPMPHKLLPIAIALILRPNIPEGRNNAIQN
jgi:hypothetical protein